MGGCSKFSLHNSLKKHLSKDPDTSSLNVIVWNYFILSSYLLLYMIMLILLFHCQDMAWYFKNQCVMKIFLKRENNLNDIFPSRQTWYICIYIYMTYIHKKIVYDYIQIWIYTVLINDYVFKLILSYERYLKIS